MCEAQADPPQGQRQAIELGLERCGREIGTFQSAHGFAPRPQDGSCLRHTSSHTDAQLQQRLTLVMRRLKNPGASSAGEIHCNDVHEN
jgi:hypothetical protein